MNYDIFGQPIGNDFKVHSHESNKESEAILKQEQKRLSANCKLIFDYLMEGKTLNSVTASKLFSMVDFRRRCCDLEENGVHISEKKSDMGKGLKDRFMTTEDKFKNLTLGF